MQLSYSPIRATSTRGERRAVRNRARFYILAPTVVALVSPATFYIKIYLVSLAVGLL